MNNKIILLLRDDMAKTKLWCHMATYENATCHTVYMSARVSARARVYIISEKAPFLGL